MVFNLLVFKVEISFSISTRIVLISVRSRSISWHCSYCSTHSGGSELIVVISIIGLSSRLFFKLLRSVRPGLANLLIFCLITFLCSRNASNLFLISGRLARIKMGLYCLTGNSRVLAVSSVQTSPPSYLYSYLRNPLITLIKRSCFDGINSCRFWLARILSEVGFEVCLLGTLLLD